MSPKPFAFWSLFVFLSLCTSVLSVRPVIQLTPKQLSNGLTYWAGKQEYHEKIDEKLLKEEATSALKSLQKQLSKDKISFDAQPKALSALWTGEKEVYYASSAKGEGEVASSSNPAGLPKQVWDPMQNLLKKGGHSFKGKCGEMMVLKEWFDAHPGPKQLPEKKMILAVKNIPDRKIEGIVEPCTTGTNGGKWGCSQVLEKVFKPKEIIRPASKSGKPSGTKGTKPPHPGAHTQKSTPLAPKSGGPSGSKGSKHPPWAHTQKSTPSAPKNGNPSGNKGSKLPPGAHTQKSTPSAPKNGNPSSSNVNKPGPPLPGKRTYANVASAAKRLKRRQSV